jgi:hypothetical protein
MQSTKKTSWDFRMGSGPDAASTMRWMRWQSGSFRVAERNMDLDDAIPPLQLGTNYAAY